MGSNLRTFGFGALAAGTAAAAALVAPQLAGTPGGWTPVTRGLSAAPSAILPATVSPAHPVTVVSTALDAQGRPVVTARTATDATAAAGLIRAGQKAPRAVAVELDAPTSALDVPTGTDPDRPLQYGLDKIRAGAAWTSSTGGGVTVAVLDTGVDAAHPDLAGQVLPGYDAIDDTTGTSSDGKGHGTHVAGIIAALTGNGIGVAGTAPDAKILPVQVLDATGAGTMSALATGIVWAADHGASVLEHVARRDDPGHRGHRRDLVRPVQGHHGGGGGRQQPGERQPGVVPGGRPGRHRGGRHRSERRVRLVLEQRQLRRRGRARRADREHLEQRRLRVRQRHVDGVAVRGRDGRPDRRRPARADPGPGRAGPRVHRRRPRRHRQGQRLRVRPDRCGVRRGRRDRSR